MNAQPLSGESLWIAIAVMAGITFFTRAIPFLLFSRGRAPSRAILYLGRVLPPAIIALLVLYCLKDTQLLRAPFGLPELLSCCAVVALHMLRRNAMLSIAGGTVLYMVLLRVMG